MTPTIESTGPSCTGSTEWRVAFSFCRISSWLSERSISSTSRRGVIRPRAERSARRMTPEIMWRSSLSSTPALSASAISVLTSSSVTRSSVSPLWPSSPRSKRPETSSNQTSGRAIEAMKAISGATCAAIRSGSRRAICLGTSSPTISCR